MLAKLLGEHFFAGGLGFLRTDAERPAHREAALRVLGWAREQLEQADMLVLDETLYALSAGILEQQELEELIAQARAGNCHLVLSGRSAPEWLVDAADLVTSMQIIYCLGAVSLKYIYCLCICSIIINKNGRLEILT